MKIANAVADRLLAKRAARKQVDGVVLAGRLSEVEYRSAVDCLEIEYLPRFCTGFLCMMITHCMQKLGHCY